MTEQAIGILRYRQPDAYAKIKGSPAYPGIQGMVWFYEFLEGTLVCVEAAGLPVEWRTERKEGADAGNCHGAMFGFHLHEGDACSGTVSDPFANAKGHFNPGRCEHPDHTGDFPVLMGNRGYVWMAFYTDRFRPSQIRGRTVIIHEMSDDYRTQPAGDSGVRIACGVVY